MSDDLLEVIGRVQQQRLVLLIERDCLDKKIAELELMLMRFEEAYKARQKEQKDEPRGHSGRARQNSN